MSGGHANKFIVQPTRWQWHKFKDLLHLYTFVGAIPLGLISLYANLFIGPAELAPIPEGYQPKEYEYYRVSIPTAHHNYSLQETITVYLFVRSHLHILLLFLASNHKVLQEIYYGRRTRSL